MSGACTTSTVSPCWQAHSEAEKVLCSLTQVLPRGSRWQSSTSVVFHLALYYTDVSRSGQHGRLSSNPGKAEGSTDFSEVNSTDKAFSPLFGCRMVSSAFVCTPELAKPIQGPQELFRRPIHDLENVRPRFREHHQQQWRGFTSLRDVLDFNRVYGQCLSPLSGCPRRDCRKGQPKLSQCSGALRQFQYHHCPLVRKP